MNAQIINKNARIANALSRIFTNVAKDAKEYAVENGFWFLTEYVEKK